MNRTVFNTRLAAFVMAGALLSAAGKLQAQSGGAAPASAPKTAEQVFKNIQVLKDAPADQIFPAMQFITASLGVECEFCHVENAFEKDDKKPKATARKMMQMQIAINKDNFNGNRAVTCYSCHRGGNDPVNTPILTEEEPAPAPKVEAANAAGGPTADQIIEKYVQAAGGADAIQKVTSRVEKGMLSTNGRQIPVEIFVKGPNKRLSVSHAPNGDSKTVFDGQVGWLWSQQRGANDMSPGETDAVKLDADLYFAAHLKQIFTDFRVRPAEKIGDRAVVPLIALRKGMPPVRLFFDQQSGLLVRMLRYLDTPVGRNPTRIDYADYRDQGGVKIPYRWTIARPNGRFTIQVSEVKQNVPVDDGLFAKPPAPAPAAK